MGRLRRFRSGLNCWGAERGLEDVKDAQQICDRLRVHVDPEVDMGVDLAPVQDLHRGVLATVLAA